MVQISKFLNHSFFILLQNAGIFMHIGYRVTFSICAYVKTIFGYFTFFLKIKIIKPPRATQ